MIHKHVLLEGIQDFKCTVYTYIYMVCTRIAAVRAASFQSQSSIHLNPIWIASSCSIPVPCILREKLHKAKREGRMGARETNKSKRFMDSQLKNGKKNKTKHSSV